ncbi:MAG: energy-coupling factor transport system ATP-binding protein [Gaiellales bacterium]|jgi:energy-coupling factor transport system ATP-binding protein|nr:energy-coupling factor transport system ATP-binding protein [Gaiellales bacterium]
MGALSFDRVSYRYPDGAGASLNDVSLHVEEGEFVLVLGESGSGKSTLLRAALGLVPHFHGGTLHGRVVTEGLDTREHRPAHIAARAGLVFQDPESQLVMRRAGAEVAFGLENLGCPPSEILTRAEEALVATGASALAERETADLSGGEQQRVAIASVLAMGQRTLLLDEPTSQLDPVAAEELLALVTRINRDRGVTVVLAEHRTSRIFAEADRVLVMEGGRITFEGSPDQAARHLASSSPWLLPPVTQAFAAAGRPELPLTVRDARRLAGPPAFIDMVEPRRIERPVAAELKRVHKRLGAVDALRGATTGFETGAVTALLGPNGAGKTTLSRIAAGLMDADAGTVRGGPMRAYVSQNPAHHALRETAAGEVAYALENLGVADPDRTRRVREELERFGLDELADRHPRDLSSGERQRLAIASVTVMRPSLLLLDEPTRGVDGLRKLALAELVRSLAADGCAVGLVTHDVDFAAEAADRVTTMARGRVLADRAPRELLAHGGFFACQVGLAFGCVTVAEAAQLLMHGRGAESRV